MVDFEKSRAKALQKIQSSALFDAIEEQRASNGNPALREARAAYWQKLDELEKWEAMPEPLPSEALCKEQRLAALRRELLALEVSIDSPAPPVADTTPAPQAAAVGDWVARARSRAAEIVKEHRARNVYPSQENIGDLIAAEFRKPGIDGTGYKVLTGATIKRHALKGISSAVVKRLSTKTRQGK